MSSHVPNGKDADAHHHNVAVDNIVVVGKSVTVPKVNANVVEANEVVASEMLANNLTVNTINGLPPGSGSGNVCTDLGALTVGAGSGTTSCLAPGTNGQVLTVAGGVPTWAAGGGGGPAPYSGTGVLTFVPTDFVEGDSVPGSTGTFTKTIDLGIVGATSAWVQVPANQGTTTYVDTISGKYTNLPYSTVYVTEDFNETKRYGVVMEETTPDGSSTVGYGTYRRTYAELGGYVFGTYNDGSFGPTTHIVFPFSVGAGKFSVQSIRLDNSGATTILEFVFDNQAATAGAFNSNSRINVFYTT